MIVTLKKKNCSYIFFYFEAWEGWAKNDNIIDKKRRIRIEISQSELIYEKRIKKIVLKICVRCLVFQVNKNHCLHRLIHLFAFI